MIDFYLFLIFDKFKKTALCRYALLSLTEL